MGTQSADVGETAERCENKAGWAGQGWQVRRTGRELGGAGGQAQMEEGGPVHLLRRQAKYSFTNLWTRRAGLSRGAASVVRSGNIDGADVAAAGWNTSTLYIVSKRLSQLTPAGGLLLW